MSRRTVTIAITVLFVLLIVVYFRYAIWSPSDALLTKHLATDLHGHFVHVWERLNLLGQGFVPVGDYWVQRGGGFPAVSNDQLVIPQELLLMITYALIGSFTVSLKILIPFFYLATLITSYWYGTVLFKRRDASLILAVTYTFSMYGVNQLEHLELIGVQPLILLALIFLEKLLRSGRPMYVILTSVFLFLVFLSNLYAMYFTLLFVAFRLAFHLVAVKQQRLETLKNAVKIGTLFSLMAIPFLLPHLFNMPTQQMKDSLAQNLLFYSQPPSLYFLRNVTFIPYLTEIYFMYLGLPVLLLALLPTILRQESRREYVFYMLVTTFFLLFAVGQYGPINLAAWSQKLVPFIRVPGRVLIMGCLSLSVCAAIGFITLSNRWPIIKRTPIVLLLVAVTFADLTAGFEPSTMTVPSQTHKVYQFIKAQPEDFRIVEISSVHDQQAMTNIYTERDTLNSVLWSFDLFEPLHVFTGLYNDYVNMNVTAQAAATYGVKYVIVNTDPRYTETYRSALKAIGGPNLVQVRRVEAWLSKSEDYRLVCNEDCTKVYENLEYRGLVFSDGTDHLHWTRRDPNTLTMVYSSPEPTSITVSQSYSEGWIAILDGERGLPIRNFNSIQQIDVPEGNHSIILYYQNHKRWFIILAAFYTALALTIICWVWKPWAGRKRD